MNDFPHISAALPLEFAIPAGLPQNGSQGDSPVSADTEIGTVPERTSDPREVLDPVKRATIVALVRLGGSRRLAAREVGCCHRTIARAAARDPQFVAELAAAESRADGKALRLIDRATDQEKYWRAAAWVLERRNPEEYGRRAPHTFTNDQVLERFTRFLHVVMPKLPAECRETLLEEYENVLSDLTENPAAALPEKRIGEKQLDKKQFEVEEEAPVPAPPPPEPLEKQCPRDEAAARVWLTELTFEQVAEMKKRAESKPRRPDWDHWRGMVAETWERAYRQSCKEYRQEVRERKARREARRRGDCPDFREAPTAPTYESREAKMGLSALPQTNPVDAPHTAPTEGRNPPLDHNTQVVSAQ